MQPPNRNIRLALLALLAQACVSGRSAVPDAFDTVTPSHADANRVADRSTVLGSELAKTSGANALDALRHARPDFLRVSTRIGSPTPAGDPAVYENGKFAGSVSQLALIPLTVIVDIRRLEPVEAKNLFGSSCPCQGGVILVRTAVR